MNNMQVHVVEYDRNMREVENEYYSLEDWCKMFRNNLFGLIADVENIIYDATGESKDKWPDDIWEKYVSVKHKLLDKAGDIERLPKNLETGGAADGKDISA